MNKKILAILALVSSLAQQAARANDIEPGKEFYTAQYTTATITIDGKLDEWTNFPVIADPKFSIPKGSGAGGRYVLFEEYAGGTWTGPDDQTSAVQVVYDKDNVYFGFTVTDDYHENAANSPWNGDSVQLMVANGDRNAQIALYNYALGGTDDAGYSENTIIMHEAGPGGTEAVVTRDAAKKKTYYEIKLPAASMGLGALTPGTKFGLGMAINDGDKETPGQRGWGGLGAHSIVFGKTPGETALVTLGANATVTEVLGTGTSALLGGDLTDPENDGLDALGAATDPSWNWAGITSNVESDFEGGENAFNIFDNKLGGGNDKWCCDDPSPGNPMWVDVEFKGPVSLTHFTVSSANDVPDRDPIDWAIQGSNDGVNFTDIYHFKDATALWTDRLQVIKFTLPAPAAPYRHIRYIAYDTPGSLHQMGEIEYFGSYGSSALAYLSAIRPTVDDFSFNANDVGSSIVDASKSTLTLDGSVVALKSGKVDAVTSFTYTPASPFPPNTTHTYRISVKDTQGNTIATDGQFTTIKYALLNASDRVTADTSLRGFVWRVHQNSAFQANDNSRPVQQLLGKLGKNNADPAAQGVAIAPGTPGAGPNDPITFEIETVINLDQAGGSNGNFTPDDQMPGFPSLDGSGGDPNGIAGEATTYIQLSKGKHTLIVNSDDGFRTTAGSINDIFRAQVAGEFSGGRGASDTAYTVYAQADGVFAFRTVWEEGGGGANFEWLEQLADGTKVLLNDDANGGPVTYRKASGGSTAITATTPLPGQTGVDADTAIGVTLSQGADAVTLSSVQLTLNGASVAANVVKNGNVITANFQPASLLPGGSTNVATVTFTAGGVSRTETWSFVVAKYGFLAANLAVTPDTEKRGFQWRVHQNAAFGANDNVRPVQQLAGLLGVNLADPAAQGAAIAPGTPEAGENMPVDFEIETVINLDQTGGSNGEFTPDEQMPGIPGTTGSTDGIAGEITTYIELTAGKHVFIVNSDDGFRTTAGNVNDIFQAQFLGEFSGGRGAADTAYSFYVEKAGVYPVRTVWQEGGGGANIEWKVVNADGTRALINDDANGAPKAYRAFKGALPTAITQVYPAAGANQVLAGSKIWATVVEGSTAVNLASAKLTVDGAPIATTATKAGNVITIAYAGGNLSVGAHTATVSYNDRTESWSFSVPAATLDVIHKYPGLILGKANYTDDKGGRTGAAGDRAMDFGKSGANYVLNPDASWLNAATALDTLTFSLWVKKYDNADSSAFWADSPASPSSQRGFQAHIPWSNGHIYFDTAGCCNGGETRIEQVVDGTTVPAFTSPAWWNDWHHYVFVKNGEVKQIYIDGALFLEGTGTTPLYSDFVRLWLGGIGGGPGGGGGNMHGQMDDFSAYGSGLSADDIAKLFAGTKPNALGAAANVLAWWDFNDAPVVVVQDPPKFTKITNNGNGTVTIEWTGGGLLQYAGAVNGPWIDATGATSPYTFTPPASVVFGRIKR